MKLICNKIFLEHKVSGHPEGPERLSAFSSLEQAAIENGENYLPLVYDKRYINLIKYASKNSMYLDSDTYTCSRSYEVACYAVGAVIKSAKENDFALVRPPGHHATRDMAMGFCLFNNLAIASKWLNNKEKRVLIVDIDSHHGNGSQEIFYNTDETLYLSLHQFPAYPGTGWVDEIGVGKGKYYNINIPLPLYAGDDLFIEALSRLIPVICQKYTTGF